MLQWFVITHNLHALQLVTSRIAGLEVEIYSPSKIELKKRKDCNASRAKETQLFPGYLFLRFDPEVVHTTTISELPGVQDFVRTGGKVATVSNGLIESLKESLLLRTDRKVTSLECRNVPPSTMAGLEYIAGISSKQERQAAFLALLQEDSHLQRAALGGTGRGSVRNCSMTEKIPVNEKLY